MTKQIKKLLDLIFRDKSASKIVILRDKPQELRENF